MSSVPSSYIDDIKRIVRSALNQTESQNIRWVHGVEKINDAEWSDVNYGVTVCTSATRPTGYHGRLIYETDTDAFLGYNGAAWVNVGGGAGAYLPLAGGTLTGDLTINKSNPYLYLKPTDATPPAVLLKDSADNIKGRMYTTGDDMVIGPDDGDLYLSTTAATGGSVLLETVGVTRLTIADALISASVNLDMGANNVYLDSGILRMSDGTGLSGSIGFTTGVQNYIQRQLISGSDYTLLSDQDYMHTWAILGTEKAHLSTADGLKLFTKIDANSNKITGLAAATANGDALRYEQLIGAYLLLSGGTMTGDLDMGGYDIRNIQELYVDVLDVDDYDQIELRSSIAPNVADTYSLGLDSYEMGYIRVNEIKVATIGAKGSGTSFNLADHLFPVTDSTYNLGSSSYAFNDLYIDRILGGAENDDAALDLDFRGDAVHRIYYNGTAANELEYKTFLRHRFMIQSTEVLNIDSDEIAMETGKKVGLNSVGGGTYLKDDASGNMELHVATGKSVKIVVG